MSFHRSFIRTALASFLVCAAVVFVVSDPSADEGMWLPQEVPQFVLEDLKSRGCALGQDDIFNSEGPA
jgi:hypothetical protein